MNILEKNERNIKLDMMKLWKQTFHDNDEYIQLVFDQYFSIRNAYYIYKVKNQIIDKDDLSKQEFSRSSESNRKILLSSMLTIPYQLEVGGERLNGRYMCGLATDPNFRNQGLMTGMIRSFIKEAEEENLDFLFLIPADDHLREYYARFGFESAFPFSINIHKSSSNECNVSSMRIGYFNKINPLIENNNNSDSYEIDRICDYIQRMEYCREFGGIIHSRKDLKCAIQESFISGGEIYEAIDYKGNVVGVVFFYETEAEIKVYYLTADTCEIRDELLSELHGDFPKRKVYIIRHEHSRNVNIENRMDHNEKMGYKGMVKFLKKDSSGDEMNKFKGGELSLMLD